jgi:hypothetical protein
MSEENLHRQEIQHAFLGAWVVCPTYWSDSRHSQRSFAPEDLQAQPSYQNPGMPGGSPGWLAPSPGHHIKQVFKDHV